ncbi:TrmB family transcriptional regulator [Candidatus Woesearchaeota archaeon]|nr:TrmB family transcriptional regulator [Candidatus Woesearchaeota archaeon]
MIVKDTFLAKLRQAFNLNIYEVKIWTALLSRGVSTAGELSDISNVPRSRSYDVLETLEKKGFVIMKLGKPIKYLAVKPEEIVRRVKKNIKENADKKLDRLEEVRGTKLFDELKLLYENGITMVDASDLSGAIKGRENINDQVSSLLSEAQKEVVMITTADGLVRKAGAFRKNLKNLNQKKINIRIVAPITKENSDIVKELSKFAEIRNTQRINSRFMIVDNKKVLFMLMGDKEVHSDFDTGIWVETPYFANALGSFFNVVWEKLEDGRKVIQTFNKK